MTRPVRPVRPFPAQLGRRIAAARTARHFTQAQLAVTAGITQPHLSQVENGLSTPTFESLYAIAAALGLHPAVLLPAAPVTHPDGRPDAWTARDIAETAWCAGYDRAAADAVGKRDTEPPFWQWYDTAILGKHLCPGCQQTVPALPDGQTAPHTMPDPDSPDTDPAPVIACAGRWTEPAAKGSDTR